MSFAQSAACLWLVQISIFHRMADRYPALRTLDTESFYGDPAMAIAKVSGFFGDEMDADAINAIVNGDLFARYSKDPTVQYDNARRMKDKEAIKAALASELAEARNWLEAHGSTAVIPATLPNTLTGERPALL